MTSATTEIADRYRRLSAAFSAAVAAIRPDQWDEPTPCEEWSVRDLVRHVVDNQGLFEGLVGRDVGEIPSVDDDPVGAFDAARAVVQADLDDPERAGETFEGFFGTTTFAAAVDRFVCFDFVIHGWDLARATGQDETLDPDDVARMWATTETFGDALRGNGVCGPAVEVGADASDTDRLVAFLGRRP